MVVLYCDTGDKVFGAILCGECASFAISIVRYNAYVCYDTGNHTVVLTFPHTQDRKIIIVAQKKDN